MGEIFWQLFCFCYWCLGSSCTSLSWFSYITLSMLTFETFFQTNLLCPWAQIRFPWRVKTQLLYRLPFLFIVLRNKDGKHRTPMFCFFLQIHNYACGHSTEKRTNSEQTKILILTFFPPCSQENLNQNGKLEVSGQKGLFTNDIMWQREGNGLSKKWFFYDEGGRREGGKKWFCMTRGGGRGKAKHDFVWQGGRGGPNPPYG